MSIPNQKPTTVDQYIGLFPSAVQEILGQLRATIMAHAPGATESISYGMPAYRAHGRPLVYFAAYPHHIGFYATPAGHARFAQELAAYKQGKGSVQFPLQQPIPYDLIANIVRFRVAENDTRKPVKRAAHSKAK
jgi:uncharacterized protein YdhG (YjbR/CyaY superfamily)